MMKRKFILIFLLSLFIFGSISFLSPEVSAASAYKTYTLDRNRNLSETNEAYEAVYMIRSLSDGSRLNGAKDLFIDSDDYMYIADTGNKRIVILNQDLQVLFTFGSEVLIKPLGIFVVDDYIYVADYGLGQTNSDIGSIYIWHFDKTQSTLETAIELVDVLSTPSSPILEADGFIFRPMKIAVDKNHTMYVVNEGTTSGVLMINASNRFIDYFASNNIDITLWQRIQRIIYANNDNVYLTKNIPAPVTNITLDNTGYFYTVTQKPLERAMGDNLKKVNIGGTNYFDEDMYVYSDIVDAWAGKVGNIYTVTSAGFLTEYDNQGNMLFMWGGKGTGNDKLGLFMSASSLAVDSNNNIYVLDDHSSRNSIQVFRETPFASQVHQALDLYNQARYVESIEVWQEVLRYNSMLDMAYRGIGLGYLMNEEYDKALEQFKIAYDKANYSEAYWEIRNLWMTENVSTLLYGLIGIVALLVVINLTNKKYQYLTTVSTTFGKIKKYRIFRELLFMFRFIKHPSDACYEVKAKKKASVLTAWITLGLLFVLNIFGILFTGFIFNNVIPEETILIKEGLTLLLPILIFIIANYLMSSLMEGEGTFKATFINTVGALMPIFIIYPFVILISNFITYNEAFLFTISSVVMLGWVGVLLFFNIKETHNYTVGQTIVNFFLTLLMMVILIVVLIMVYLMVIQVTNFVTDIIKEVILRE